MNADACYREALELLRDWLREADSRGAPEANAAALATADADGRPSVRTVYLQWSDRGEPVFFVNLHSGKGRQLEENPRVGLCLFWPLLRRQVTLEANARLLDAAEADDLWHRRPRESALAAWASRPELTEGDAERLHQDLNEARRAFDFEPVPRPYHWAGFRIEPDRLEFWNQNWRRAHQRRLYSQEESGWVRHIQEP